MDFFEINADDLPLFMACNPSRSMPRSVPEDQLDHTERNEGTAAHYMAQKAFEGVPISTLVNQKAPNGVFMTAEMAEYVSCYLSALDCGQMEVDTSFQGVNYKINGRADHIKLSQNYDYLNIDDFKFGWGLIEPEMNWTLISHAIGYISNLNFALSDDFKIRMTIHQPRPHHPDGRARTWEISLQTLQILRDQLEATIANPSNMLTTNSLCRKCHAAATCPAYQASGMNAVDCQEIAFSDDISNDVLRHELITLSNAGSVIENRLKALQELATYRLKQGQVINDYALDRTMSNSKWKSNITAETIKALCGKDISKSSMLTPAQAKTIGVPDYIIDTMAERVSTGVKLVRIDANKRAKKLLKG